MIPWTDQNFNLLITLTFYIISMYQVPPNLAGFPDILNQLRNNGVFGIAKTPKFRA